MPCFQGFEVFAGCGTTVGGAVELAELGSCLINGGSNDPWFGVILNPASQSFIQDIIRHIGFELGVADE